FAEAEVCQSCAEGLILGGRWRVVERRTQVAKADDLAGLLAAYHERPCHTRAAEQRDELAAPHSITSLAMERTSGGMVSPSAFAVWRLMIGSIRLDCWPGRSPGFSPLRIRPV